MKGYKLPSIFFYPAQQKHNINIMNSLTYKKNDINFCIMIYVRKSSLFIEMIAKNQTLKKSAIKFDIFKFFV